MLAMVDAPSDAVAASGRVYKLGTVPAKGGGTHKVVIALGDQGTAAAAVVAALLLEDFPSVRSVLMVGIAGAVPSPMKPDDHVRLGDIVVSGEHGVVAYDFVKEHRDHVEPRHPPRAPSADLLRATSRLMSEMLTGKKPWLESIQRADALTLSGRPAPETDVLHSSSEPDVVVPHPSDRARLAGEPRVFVGTIACANRLLKNPVHRDKLRDQFAVRAVEMEGFGIAEATWATERGYLVVRGTCDYCDRSKGDAWQAYAAIVAAAFARSVLGEVPSRVPHKPTWLGWFSALLVGLALGGISSAAVAASRPELVATFVPLEGQTPELALIEVENPLSGTSVTGLVLDIELPFKIEKIVELQAGGCTGVDPPKPVELVKLPSGRFEERRGYGLRIVAAECPPGAKIRVKLAPIIELDPVVRPDHGFVRAAYHWRLPALEMRSPWAAEVSLPVELTAQAQRLFHSFGKRAKSVTPTPPPFYDLSQGIGAMGVRLERSDVAELLSRGEHGLVFLWSPSTHAHITMKHGVMFAYLEWLGCPACVEVRGDVPPGYVPDSDWLVQMDWAGCDLWLRVR